MSAAAVVIAVLAGPLLAAAGAKLLSRPGTIDWPFTGALAKPRGPRLVAAGELAVVTGALMLPTRPAGALLAGTYTLLAVVAWRLRGRRCACFGAARLAALGNGHVAANALAAAVTLVAAAAGGGRGAVAVHALVMVVCAGLTYATVALLRVRDQPSSAAVACGEPVHMLRLYVADGCPSCHALLTLMADLDPDRRTRIALVELAADRGDAPPEARGYGMPHAIPLAADGTPVCRPATGVELIWRHIETMTLAR